MSVIFSRQCEYGLQAVLHLAVKPPGQWTSIRGITKELGIPYHFVGKILQDLVYKGLLVSQKGPSGGFALAHPAKDITLLQIVEAIDGMDLMYTCVMGLKECSGKNPCAVHHQWGGLRDKIQHMLANQSIEDMARDTKKGPHKN